MNRLKLFSLILIFIAPAYTFCLGQSITDSLYLKTYQTDQPVELNFDEYNLVFGFSNKEGKQILTIEDSLSEPESYIKTISSPGKIVQVKFTGKKNGVEGKDYQLSYGNFINCAGYLYKCEAGAVNYKYTSVLMTDKFLSERKYVGIPQPETKPLSKEIANAIEKITNKKIKKTFPFVKLGKDARLYIIDFEVSNDTAMYSLVLVKPDKLAFQDNITTYSPSGTWRVGDNGIVKPSMFRVLGQFSGKYGTEFILDWIGTEGFFTQYIIENGNRLEMVKNEYRYKLPQ